MFSWRQRWSKWVDQKFKTHLEDTAFVCHKLWDEDRRAKSESNWSKSTIFFSLWKSLRKSKDETQNSDFQKSRNNMPETDNDIEHIVAQPLSFIGTKQFQCVHSCQSIFELFSSVFKIVLKECLCCFKLNLLFLYKICFNYVSVYQWIEKNCMNQCLKIQKGIWFRSRVCFLRHYLFFLSYFTNGSTLQTIGSQRRVKSTLSWNTCVLLEDDSKLLLLEQRNRILRSLFLCPDGGSESRISVVSIPWSYTSET